MKLNTGKYKYKELIKWYKKPNSQPFKRIINNQFSEIKDLIGGKHALFIGLSDFKKKFQSLKYVSFLTINEISSSGPDNGIAKLPFEDDSYDIIIVMHALDYTDGPYEFIREIDRITTDDGKVVMIGFNNFSLWGLLKPLMNKSYMPWSLNFYSLYSVREWFKILGYETSYKETRGLIPIISKHISKYLEKISILQKFLAPNLGGLYFYVFYKKTIPLTPVKLKFKEKYIVNAFPKSSLNRIK